MTSQAETISQSSEAPWYAGVTGYQWLVLVIASIGWVFDAFEGQIFSVTRQDLLKSLQLPAFWGDRFVACFLVGGALGGIAFGRFADRFGRKPAIALSILFYALFSGLTCLATSLWMIAALRFLVGLGVGGEWAVAAALVAEVFPARARARAGGIFHATSVMGTWIAALVGYLVGTHWQYAYLASVVPALLVFWVMVSVKEPTTWKAAIANPKSAGGFRELIGSRRWAHNAVFGILLGAVGLATFWGVVVNGQDLTRHLLERLVLRGAAGDPAKIATGFAQAANRGKIAYGFIQAAGMGVGFLCFGPVTERIGRRGAFLLWHLAAAAIVPITCYLPRTYWQMLVLLPFFGFFTGGLHAGYAIYFPELFPSRLRATGAGICFNGGRLLAAGLLLWSAQLKSRPNFDLPLAVTMFGTLYLLGAIVLLFLPETRGKPLPE